MNNDKTQEQPKEASSTNPLLDQVKAERERLEKVRDEAKAQADRLEQLRADQLLSGTGGIAQPVKEIPETERKKEAAADFFKGSEIEKAIRKHG